MLSGFCLTFMLHVHWPSVISQVVLAYNFCFGCISILYFTNSVGPHSAVVYGTGGAYGA